MRKKKKTSAVYLRISDLSYKAYQMGYKQQVDSSGNVYFEKMDEGDKAFERI